MGLLSAHLAGAVKLRPTSALASRDLPLVTLPGSESTCVRYEYPAVVVTSPGAHVREALTGYVRMVVARSSAWPPASTVGTTSDCRVCRRRPLNPADFTRPPNSAPLGAQRTFRSGNTI